MLTLGNSREERGLALETRTKWPIPNNTSKEKAPAALMASRELWKKLLPEATLRSLTATYNCVGMVFATRRSHINPDHVRDILEKDGFSKVPDAAVKLGDLVLYCDGNTVLHIGMVAATPSVDGHDTWVLSKWGDDGEYYHRLKYVPEIFGEPTEFWTHRKLMP